MDTSLNYCPIWEKSRYFHQSIKMLCIFSFVLIWIKHLPCSSFFGCYIIYRYSLVQLYTNIFWFSFLTQIILQGTFLIKTLYFNVLQTNRVNTRHVLIKKHSKIMNWILKIFIPNPTNQFTELIVIHFVYVSSDNLVVHRDNVLLVILFYHNDITCTTLIQINILHNIIPWQDDDANTQYTLQSTKTALRRDFWCFWFEFHGLSSFLTLDNNQTPF